MNTNIIKEYANANNGGREYVRRDSNGYYINSYIPGVGWMGERQVTLDQVKSCLSYTNAPSDVIAAILD